MSSDEDKRYLNGNIAGRLVDLLQKIKSVSVPENKIFPGWTKVFNCPKEPPNFAFENALKTIALVSKVYDLMLISGFPKDIFEKPLLHLYGIFSESLQNTNASWSNLQGQITADKIAVVKSCAAVLNSMGHTFGVSNKNLDEFEGETKKLAKYLSELDLHPLIKKRFLDLLQSVLDAIQEFRVFGSDELKEVYVKALGELAGWEVKLNEPENQPVRDKIRSYVKDLGLLLSVMKDGKELVESGWEVIKKIGVD